MFGFLGDNVSDHFAAAVANVQGDGSKHFEQAIFADELSSESLAAVRSLVAAHWQQMLERLVPQLESMIAADAQAGRTADQRLRVGLYSYDEDMTSPPSAKED
jgi:acid stress-induced BolA-like protein IbaG/YrbA